MNTIIIKKCEVTVIKKEGKTALLVTFSNNDVTHIPLRIDYLSEELRDKEFENLKKMDSRINGR